MVHIQIGPDFRFEFVPRDTEESEFVDSVGFGCVAFSVCRSVRGESSKRNRYVRVRMCEATLVAKPFSSPQFVTCSTRCNKLLQKKSFFCNNLFVRLLIC